MMNTLVLAEDWKRRLVLVLSVLQIGRKKWDFFFSVNCFVCEKKMWEFFEDK